MSRGSTALLLGVTLALGGCAVEPPPDPESFALELHREAIVVDTHSDTTPRFQDPNWHFEQRHERTESHMDLPRIREGGLDVQFWSIYMGRREGDGRAIREALERIDAVWELAARLPDEIAVATTADEVRRHVADGKLVSLMGVEGGHMIEDRLPILRSYHRLGVRYMTLTHSFHTSWADSSGTSSVPEPEHDGLTPFGERVVREMNRIGMMVDISHVADATFWDVIAVASAPLIASHSSCRAVANHARNMSDEMLRALAENGGVVMINFYPAYTDEAAGAANRERMGRMRARLQEVREARPDDVDALREARRAFAEANPPPVSPLSALLDHFDHAIEVAGPDHVGIGADWDGVPFMPDEMQEISDLPNLTLGLLERGHSPETLRKVLGENLLRVMAEVEAVSARLRERPAGPG